MIQCNKKKYIIILQVTLVKMVKKEHAAEEHIPFRYGGVLHRYDEDVKDLTGNNYHCYHCGRSMVTKPKSMPYIIQSEILSGKNKGNFRFRVLCRDCAYSYGNGVIEMDGKTYYYKNDFCESKYKESVCLR